MLRKSLLAGLTLMLVAIFVFLIIKGRREESRRAGEESQRAPAPVEVTKTARSTATRVIAPKDLEASESPDAGGPAKAAAQYVPSEVAIQNRGAVPYHDIMLQLAFLGSGGKVLETRMQLIAQTLPPGQRLIVANTGMNGAPPPGTSAHDLSILYCSFGPAPAR